MKKTVIGILIMAVAIMMTLSGAVFAAETMTVSAPSKVEKGATVTVTVKYPENVAGHQYTVTYNPDVLEYVSGDANPVKTAGTLKLANLDLNYNAETSSTLTFTAKAAGSSEIKISDGAKLIKTDSSETTEVNANSVVVEVTEPVATTTPEPTQAPAEPAKTEEPTTPAKTTEPTTTASTDKKTGDEVTKKIPKTGFDAMYVVYLVAAVLVAGGVVAVAKRK